MTCQTPVGGMIYIICDFFTQILLHEEEFADQLTGTLHYPQPQGIVTPLQFRTLCNMNTSTLNREKHDKLH